MGERLLPRWVRYGPSAIAVTPMAGVLIISARVLGSAAVRASLRTDQMGSPVVNNPHEGALTAFRLTVTGGGTGGHTYPALTAIRALRDRLAGSGRVLEVLWIGAESGLEARVAPAEGIPFTPVATGKIRRSSNPLKMLSAANVRDMARVPLGVAQARKAIAEFRPDVVLATGGYAAVPAGLAARLCGRPLVLHEQTVRLGLANRKLAGSATRITVSSESTLELLSEEARSIHRRGDRESGAARGAERARAEGGRGTGSAGFRRSAAHRVRHRGRPGLPADQIRSWPRSCRGYWSTRT